MEFDLHDWQDEALDAWIKNGKKGIVEAVTGSGKTYLALAAIHYLYGESKKLRTIVVVPTIALQLQWKDRIEKLLPGNKVGLWGGGESDSIGTHKIIVSVINTAVSKGPERLRSLGSLKKWKKFLIADECHRYVVAETFSNLRTKFHWDAILAMTATLGNDQFYVPGFGEVIYTYGFKRAVTDGLVPKFNVLNVAVPLTSKEKKEYDELTDKFSDRLKWVKQVYEEHLYDVPYDFFFRKLSQIMKNEPGDHIPIKALFKTLFERVAIAYMADLKMQLAENLLQTLAVQGNRKVIVFFERIASINDLLESIEIKHEEKEFKASELVDRTMKNLGSNLVEKVEGTWIGEIHSGLKQDERQEKLNEFKNEQPAILLTCRMLDEGIDVPDIDAAILVASTKSKRQRIQRFGRVLRMSEKKPLIITLIVPETNEGRIIQDDEDTFEGAADLHESTLSDANDKVLDLMNEPGEAEPPDEPPALPEGHWARKLKFASKVSSENIGSSTLVLLITHPNSGRELELLPKSVSEEIAKKTTKSLFRRFEGSNPKEGIAYIGNHHKFETIILNFKDKSSRPKLPVTINYYFKFGTVRNFFNFRNPLLDGNQWDAYCLEKS
jgi:RNA polymerase primary sigma factor